MKETLHPCFDDASLSRCRSVQTVEGGASSLIIITHRVHGHSIGSLTHSSLLNCRPRRLVDSENRRLVLPAAGGIRQQDRTSCLLCVPVVWVLFPARLLVNPWRSNLSQLKDDSVVPNSTYASHCWSPPLVALGQKKHPCVGGL